MVQLIGRHLNFFKSDSRFRTLNDLYFFSTYWYRVLTSECRLYELRNKKKISLAAATKIMNNIIYSYKNSGLSMGMILAGGDMNQVSLYYLDSDGTRTMGKVFSVGSGSIFAYGVLDSGYKWELTDEEAYGK